MRTAFVCLLVALTTLTAQAAPAPLPKRGGVSEADQLAFVESELARRKPECAERNIYLLGVVRKRGEWLVFYRLPSPPGEDRVVLGLVRVRVEDYRRFGPALREA